jgi:hypothetical protein
MRDHNHNYNHPMRCRQNGDLRTTIKTKEAMHFLEKTNDRAMNYIIVYTVLIRIIVLIKEVYI